MRPQLKEIQWPKWRIRRLLGVGAYDLGLQESTDSIPHRRGKGYKVSLYRGCDQISQDLKDHIEPVSPTRGAL